MSALTFGGRTGARQRGTAAGLLEAEQVTAASSLVNPTGPVGFPPLRPPIAWPSPREVGLMGAAALAARVVRLGREVEKEKQGALRAFESAIGGLKHALGATQGGLLRSEDGGKAWEDAYWLRQPATMVHVTPDGTVYAFVAGTGLIRTAEPTLSWQTVSQDGFGGTYPLHFAVDPSNQSQLYATTFDPESKAQALLASDDGGETWIPLGQAGD
jgi:hypothetical protein